MKAQVLRIAAIRAAAVAKELDGLAAQLDRSASSRSGQDAARYHLLASLVKERSTKL